MNEVKMTVEIPGLAELVAEMRKITEMTMGSDVSFSFGEEAKPPVEQKLEGTGAPVEEKPEATEAPESDSDLKVAGRKTYIFFKKTKTGTVVEKGEEVPAHDGATGVGLTKWNELCAKFDLDPATGEKNPEVPEPAADDDDGLGDIGEEAANDDDDLGLGTEEGTIEVDKDTLREKLIEVMKGKGRETVLKLFKKYGATNAETVPEESYADLYADAEKVLAA